LRGNITTGADHLIKLLRIWSGRPGSNRRHSAWEIQSYSRHNKESTTYERYRGGQKGVKGCPGGASVRQIVRQMFGIRFFSFCALQFSVFLPLFAVAQSVPEPQNAPEPQTNSVKSDGVKPVHRFLSRDNVIPLATLALLDAADGYTTSASLTSRRRELNPLAAPFVKTTSGNALYFAASYGLSVTELAFIHHLEKTHARHARYWHRVERVALWPAVAEEVQSVQANTRYLLK
jgi:hypothetical protein